MNNKIVHMTTAHARNEVRIFLKECTTLSSAGYNVSLIVADGRGKELVNGINIEDVGLSKGRFHRMLIIPIKMLYAAIKLNADIYHMHEPELLLIALLLKKKRKKVIYDSHEDVPRTILSREWIPKKLRTVVSYIYEIFENFVAKRIMGVIGATPHIAKRFSNINFNTLDINNYPLLNEITLIDRVQPDSIKICYQGLISIHRGIFEILHSLKYTKAELVLAGPMDVGIYSKAVKMEEWEKVDYQGVVDRLSVNKIMQQSYIGLVIFHPEANHINAQPNKMFEYMGAGLPIIGSNFPLWKEIIEGNNCGICVNPLDPIEIASAINYLLDNPCIAKRMGENGKNVVINKYNWQIEGKKLVNFYKNIQ